MHKGLSDIGYKVKNQVHFNQLIVRAEDDTRTQKILRDIQINGVMWCGSAVWKGNTVIGISICSWQTNQQDLVIALKEFERAFLN